MGEALGRSFSLRQRKIEPRASVDQCAGRPAAIRRDPQTGVALALRTGLDPAMIDLLWQAFLRLARGVVADLRRPWEKTLTPQRLTPARVRRGFRYIHPIPDPAEQVKTQAGHCRR